MSNTAATPRARRPNTARRPSGKADPAPSVAVTTATQAPPLEMQFPPPGERMPKLPNVYADTIQDVIYGVHTTKLILAEETGHPSDLRPVAMVTIPTESLVAACLRILENIASSDIVEHIDARQRNFSKQLKALMKAAKP